MYLLTVQQGGNVFGYICLSIDSLGFTGPTLSSTAMVPNCVTVTHPDPHAPKFVTIVLAIFLAWIVKPMHQT